MHSICFIKTILPYQHTTSQTSTFALFHPHPHTYSLYWYRNIIDEWPASQLVGDRSLKYARELSGDSLVIMPHSMSHSRIHLNQFVIRPGFNEPLSLEPILITKRSKFVPYSAPIILGILPATWS